MFIAFSAHNTVQSQAKIAQPWTFQFPSIDCIPSQTKLMPHRIALTSKNQIGIRFSLHRYSVQPKWRTYTSSILQDLLLGVPTPLLEAIAILELRYIHHLSISSKGTANSHLLSDAFSFVFGHCDQRSAANRCIWQATRNRNMSVLNSFIPLWITTRCRPWKDRIVTLHTIPPTTSKNLRHNCSNLRHCRKVQPRLHLLQGI